jgi:hypothetical protein
LPPACLHPVSSKAMRITKTMKIILTITLPLLSILMFWNYPVLGLYISCITTFVLSCLYINLKRPIKYSFATLFGATTFIILVNKAFELQGQKLITEIVEYYKSNSKSPPNLRITNRLLLNSFTPTFDKYQYNSTYDSTTDYLFHISYKNFWGKDYKYCDKCGNFECDPGY